MSNRKGFVHHDATSPKESEITTYTENTTTQSVPSLRVKAISLSFIDPQMEKGFKKWTLQKYDRFHVFLYAMILIWVSLLFIFDYLEHGFVSPNYFRIGYYAIALIGILVTKLTTKHNDFVAIILITILLVLSTGDDVTTFNSLSDFSSLESNWFPMLVILHASLSLIHSRSWLYLLIVPTCYFVSYCISRSFFHTNKVNLIDLELVRHSNIMVIINDILHKCVWYGRSISTTLPNKKSFSRGTDARKSWWSK
eukprot:NODE_35_length_36362_cov_0.944434.p20 type:complete len:253 gc:universal NODE_35_length_36362_cov_0.944434:1948-2706(+)